MSSRSAFYDAVIHVDWWLVTAPPGSPLDGDVALLASSGCTGAFAGHDGELAFYSALTTTWRFQTASTTPGMRGITMWVKKAGPDFGRYYSHDGTSLIGPLLTRHMGTTDASVIIAGEEFGD